MNRKIKTFWTIDCPLPSGATVVERRRSRALRRERKELLQLAGLLDAKFKDENAAWDAMRKAGLDVDVFFPCETGYL